MLGLIENMSGFACPHCGEITNVFSGGGGEAMADEMGLPFLGRLPFSPEVVTLTDHGQPLLGAAASPALKEAFNSIVSRLLGD